MRAIRPSALGRRTERQETGATPPAYAGRIGKLRQTGWHLVLGVLSVTFAIPLLWMLSSALKENKEIFTVPVQWLPEILRWENFWSVLTYPGSPSSVSSRTACCTRGW